MVVTADEATGIAHLSSDVSGVWGWWGAVGVIMRAEYVARPNSRPTWRSCDPDTAPTTERRGAAACPGDIRVAHTQPAHKPGQAGHRDPTRHNSSAAGGHVTGRDRFAGRRSLVKIHTDPRRQSELEHIGVALRSRWRARRARDPPRGLEIHLATEASHDRAQVGASGHRLLAGQRGRAAPRTDDGLRAAMGTRGDTDRESTAGECAPGAG